MNWEEWTDQLSDLWWVIRRSKWFGSAWRKNDLEVPQQFSIWSGDEWGNMVCGLNCRWFRMNVQGFRHLNCGGWNDFPSLWPLSHISYPPHWHPGWSAWPQMCKVLSLRLPCWVIPTPLRSPHTCCTPLGRCSGYASEAKVTLLPPPLILFSSAICRWPQLEWSCYTLECPPHTQCREHQYGYCSAYTSMTSVLTCLLWYKTASLSIPGQCLKTMIL